MEGEGQKDTKTDEEKEKGREGERLTNKQRY